MSDQTAAPTENETAAIGAMGFNPFDPVFRENPYPTYAELLRGEPLREGLLGAYIVPHYADCVAMLRDPNASNDQRNSDAFAEMVQQGTIDADAELLERRPFLFMDPPDHTRLRGLVNKAFTPHVVEGLRPRIQQIVDELVATALERGSMDVIPDLAYPLPVRVISEMLGVPPEDNDRFGAWSRELARGLDPDFVVPQDELERRNRAIEQFADYFRELIELRRREPKDDLISGLIAAEEEGEKLSENELLSTCILLLVAGHETTVNLIGNGVKALIQHPDEARRLRDDPSLIRTTVEEVLRYDPPVQLTGRIAKEDIRLPNGVIPKGKQGVLLLGAANHDPEQFPDPERFDVGRQDNRHIAFGMGIHFCLGAPLARVEGQIAIGTLVARTRDLALAGNPVYRQQFTLRGLESLAVRLSPA